MTTSHKPFVTFAEFKCTCRIPELCRRFVDETDPVGRVLTQPAHLTSDWLKSNETSVANHSFYMIITRANSLSCLVLSLVRKPREFADRSSSCPRLSIHSVHQGDRFVLPMHTLSDVELPRGTLTNPLDHFSGRRLIAQAAPIAIVSPSDASFSSYRRYSRRWRSRPITRAQ
jgi:hypothetical protein